MNKLKILEERMKENIGFRILWTLPAVAGILFIGYIAVIFSSLLGGLLFYTPLIAALFIGLALYTAMSIIGLPQRRIRNRLLLGFLVLCALTTAGYEIRQAYHNSFAEVDEPEIDLGGYAPFAENTLAVRLDAPASYRIRDHLPKLDGATALYPLYSAFVQAVYPEGTYNPYDFEMAESPVICTTTPDAYNNLLYGKADIIFAAGPSEQQINQFKSKGLELKLTPIGREAFVFFVNKRNPVSSLTSSQIKDIYSGAVTNWEEVGGKDETIRAFQRPEGSGSQTMLQKVMKGTELMKPPTEDIADAMSGIISRTANYKNYKNAIGYSFLFYASEMNRSGEIKLLDIDGIHPDKASIRSGEYPFAAEFYAVTAGSGNPHIEAFIQWMQSDEGQQLVEKTGFTSLR
ncbi:PstS family phosphate ABC transporter substrate-binding protein [Paenibacillus sp. CN-4]|uniref:PstS family phosphate ABC transporter substrate-binding protein n=1 Tax=Paenibacillus nanchangensis TaxID=3348343 RepID=UPI00397B4A8C